MFHFAFIWKYSMNVSRLLAPVTAMKVEDKPICGQHTISDTPFYWSQQAAQTQHNKPLCGGSSWPFPVACLHEDGWMEMGKLPAWHHLINGGCRGGFTFLHTVTSFSSMAWQQTGKEHRNLCIHRVADHSMKINEDFGARSRYLRQG